MESTFVFPVDDALGREVKRQKMAGDDISGTGLENFASYTLGISSPGQSPFEEWPKIKVCRYIRRWIC